MRVLGRVLAAAALAVIVLDSSMAGAAVGPGWRLTRIVRPCGRAPGGLFSVAAVSRTAAWAEGAVQAVHCAGFIEHWNGTSWRQQQLPASIARRLDDGPIAASSARDVWVFPVGGLSRRRSSFMAFDAAAHWNGHRWSVSSFPRQMTVTSADAFTGANVWAFGTIRHGIAGDVPYVARYNGKRWRTARLPGPVVSAGATAATDIWAVGPSDKTASAPVRRQTLLAMHWNGKGWTTFVLPKISWPAAAVSMTGQVAAVSPSEFWWQYTTADDGGNTDRIGLLHCSAGRCEEIGLPPNAGDILALAQDGRGGVVISALDQNPKTFNEWQEWYDYSAGHWSGQVQLSPRRFNSMYFGLAWIPGTQSVWSVGEADANSDHARVLSEGVVARYGR